jgi:phosphoribosylformylglycinamidine cyclo-ligase
MPQGEYAQSGVDYTKIEPFKMAMIEAAKRTADYPEFRHVRVVTDVLHSHGGIFEYLGDEPHMFCQTHEGLGNKNWIAEWMYQNSGIMIGQQKKTWYDNMAWDTAMMAVNDVIAQGALPVICTDEVAAGDSEWFNDTVRAQDLASGYISACRSSGMALVQGESPALKYLINATPPVKSAPSLSCCVTGILAPKTNLITGQKLAAGDRIVGVRSTGIHANGISLVIKRALELPDQFMTRMPGGQTLGDEVLKETGCYVELVERLLEQEVQIHALIPGTGGGVAKVAFDKRPFTYQIHSWPRVPPIFEFMQELGVTHEDCLTTFNMGVGYYVIVPPSEVERVVGIAQAIGYGGLEIGRVEEGPRSVNFTPDGHDWAILQPPGD